MYAEPPTVRNKWETKSCRETRCPVTSIRRGARCYQHRCMLLDKPCQCSDITFCRVVFQPGMLQEIEALYSQFWQQTDIVQFCLLCEEKDSTCCSRRLQA